MRLVGSMEMKKSEQGKFGGWMGSNLPKDFLSASSAAFV